MNALDAWGCFGSLGEVDWMPGAQALAAHVGARRGLATHLLFGRPLQGFARLQAERHAYAVAQRQRAWSR